MLHHTQDSSCWKYYCAVLRYQHAHLLAILACGSFALALALFSSALIAYHITRNVVTLAKRIAIACNQNSEVLANSWLYAITVRFRDITALRVYITGIFIGSERLAENSSIALRIGTSTAQHLYDKSRPPKGSSCFLCAGLRRYSVAK